MAEEAICEIWGFYKLAYRLKGTKYALREMKKRGEAGAIAGWAIYADYVKFLTRHCFDLPDAAYRVSMISDLEAVGEMDLIKKIEALHSKYPEGVPEHEVLDLTDEWPKDLEERVGQRIPVTVDEVTPEQKAESRRITREMWGAPKEEEPPAVPEVEVEELKEVIEAEEAILMRMKEDLRQKLERMKA